MQQLTFRNSIIWDDGVTQHSFEPSITFSIELLHPCRRTSFDTISIGTITYQLHSGLDMDTTLSAPTDAASTLYGDGWSTCGQRSYSIVDSNGNVPTWVTAVYSDDNTNDFHIRVNIDDESYATTTSSADPTEIATYSGVPAHAMTLTVGFVDYPVADDADHPTIEFSFEVDVIKAVCDCTLILWNEPENIPLIMNAMVVTTPAEQELLVAGPLESSLTATSGARACDHSAASDQCEYEYTVEARMADDQSALPDWITFDDVTKMLVATPYNDTHIGEFYVELEQVRTSNGVTTVYTAAHITVGCYILTWDPPVMPTLVEATYTVFDPNFYITMAPPFAQ